jgi:hypothetical protein
MTWRGGTIVEHSGPSAEHPTVIANYGGAEFRLDWIEERMTVRDLGTADEIADYYVNFSGPVQTKAGNDHARHRGEASYRSTTSGGRTRGDAASIPSKLVRLLRGPDVLRKELN